jgi:hypothetical protein
MNRLLSATLAGAGLLLVGSISANAAPITPQAPDSGTAIAKVHGDHRHCRRGHRHNRWGDWRSCGYSYRDSGPSVYLNFGSGHRHRGHHHRDHHRGHRDRH